MAAGGSLSEAVENETSAAEASIESTIAEANILGEVLNSGRSKALEPIVVSKTRFKRWRQDEHVVYRNKVPYYDLWTIRAGVTLLRLPAYARWESISPSTDFFKMQSQTGESGYYLASALMDKGFIKSMKTRYVSFFSLVWVPQEHAFTQMTLKSFETFKEEVQQSTVAERKRLVQREDFMDFEDYINFKFGHDERVEDFVDGFMIRAIDEQDLVIYFGTSSFIYRSAKTDIVEPMIVTITYALVHNKLIRVDMKRLFNSEDDISALVAFSQRYIEDMRKLNALSERKRR